MMRMTNLWALARLLGWLAGLALWLAAGAAQAGPQDGYYLATRQDLRRCPWPACGGIYVKQANAKTTRCADGVPRQDCYVAALDTQGLGLQDAEAARFNEVFSRGRGLARGRLLLVKQAAGQVPTLSATEAWLAQAPKPPSHGAFHAAANNGIVCIASPCNTLALARLNSPRPARAVAGLQLDALGLSAAALAQVQARLDRGGVLVAGLPVPVTGEAGTGTALSARQVYLPAKGTDPGPPFPCDHSRPDCPAGNFCETPAGRCGDARAAGQCQARPQACYMLYLPVCGCDGKTYSNDCVRQSAGAGLDHPGACQPPGPN
jgi:hypothetical protein